MALSRIACSLMLAWLAALPAPAAAEEPVHPWERLGVNLAAIYGWPNVLYHVGAGAITPPLVEAADEPVQVFFQQQHALDDAWGTAALLVGGGVPIAVPAVLYLGGLATDQSEIITAGSAAIQAGVIQVVAVSALKWFTDRAGPFPDGDPRQQRWSSSLTRDSLSARAFDFDPFDVKWGLRWPSGHTASNVALVSALYGFYPDEPWIALVGYPYALLVGVGMIEGDYHWLSDIVAGALIGHIVGWVVGREMRVSYEARNAKRRAFAQRRRSGRYTPLPDASAGGGLELQLGVLPGPLGLSLTGRY